MNEHQIESFRSCIPRMNADVVWLMGRMRSMAERPPAAAEIRTSLEGFSQGTRTIEEIRTAFDTKGRAQWSSYGLGGMSFAMFLNMLVKYIPNRRGLTDALLKAVATPEDNEAAERQARGLLEYLERLIQNKVVQRKQLHPARIPMFLSTWWYFQAPDRWPIYYVTTRHAFESKGLIAASGDLVKDYLDFRDRYVELSGALGLGFDEVETLALWITQREGKDDRPPLPILHEVAPGTDQLHTHVQWMLAKLGAHFGCQVWLASRNGSTWQGEPLSSLGLPEVPDLGLGPRAQAVVASIDVVWFRPNGQVVAAFEVETATSGHSGVLRMSDLSVVLPNFVFPLYIVAPSDRAEKIERGLRRATFQYLELHKRCGFIRSEDLLRDAAHIRKFAGDPSALDRLASRVKDVDVA